MYIFIYKRKIKKMWQILATSEFRWRAYGSSIYYLEEEVLETVHTNFGV